MAYDTEVGQGNIRATYYDKAVKGLAAPVYKFKQACNISTTGAWTNYFYREDPAVLAGLTGNTTKGIPRGAEFPQAAVAWERVSSVIQKYGLEQNIPYEDLISNEIDVKERTLIKIAEGVAKAVDDEIWSVLSEGQNAINIQSFAIAANYQWNAGADSSFAIIDDLLRAKQKIAEQNYPTDNLMCFVNPADYRSIMNYLASKGAQFPALGNEVAANGNMGTVAGIKIIVSNSVTADYALVCVPKRCATWKELVPLQTTTKEDPYKSLTIRAVEMGVTQLTDPLAVCLIVNTRL